MSGEGNGVLIAPEYATAEGKVNLSELLKAFEPGRVAMKGLLEPMFKDLWTVALQCLEEVLPEHKIPGAADAKLFAAMRHRVLNAGNKQVRELVNLLGCFAVQEVIRRERVMTVVAKGRGPYNLPPGCKMPNE